LVCGVLGILMAVCCWPIAFPLSITAIVMGAASLHPPNKEIAIGGTICGVFGLLLSIAAVILSVVLNLLGVQNPGQNPFGP
jgi:hypothetical protein